MKKKVFVIDDKPEIIQLLKLFLSNDFEVGTAENGLDALSKLQKGYIPDVIVCDWNMPEIDGYEFLKQIKNSGAFSTIPVIILSSVDKSSERIKMLKLGARDYMIKPFNPDELKARIDNILDTLDNEDEF